MNTYFDTGRAFGRLVGCISCLYMVLLLLALSAFLASPTSAQQQFPASPDAVNRPAQNSTTERGPLLSLCAIVLGLGLFGGFRLYRQAQLMKHPERLREARQHLLLRIARLDDRYTQRQIGENAYHRKRDRLKQQALHLTLRGMTQDD